MATEPPQSPGVLERHRAGRARKRCFTFTALALQSWAPGPASILATWEPRATGVCLRRLIRQQESLLGPPIFPQEISPSGERGTHFPGSDKPSWESVITVLAYKGDLSRRLPSDPMDCGLPGSSIHGIFQARVLEWGAIAFSVGGCYIVVLLLS